MIAEGFFFCFFLPLISGPISHSRSRKQKAPLPCLFALPVRRECRAWTQQPLGLVFHSVAPSAVSPAACIRACVHVDSGTLPVFKAHHRAGWCPFPEKGEVVAHVLCTCEGGSVQRPPCGLTHPNGAALRPTSAAACKFFSELRCSHACSSAA